MGNKKDPHLKKVRTVRDLARLADDIGIQPSVLLWLESLTVCEVEEITGALRPAASVPLQASPGLQPS